MDDQLTVGSLFSGIGGFDLGFERAGMRTAWFCEVDPFCRRVLARHWPDVPCFEDVRELRGSEVEPVDVLCGGFPCQDLSYAGKGAGLEGSRSGLWKEFARLIGELQPRYVVVENVPALRSRGLGVVLADLAACGFDAEWDCLPASAFGAPHRRDRVWIVAHRERSRLEGLGANAGRAQVAEPRHDGPSCLSLADADLGGRDGRPRIFWTGGGLNLRTAVAHSNREARHESGRAVEALPEPGAVERLGRCGCSGTGGLVGDAHGPPPDAHAAQGRSRGAVGESGWWLAEPDVGRVAHGVPARVDRLRSLGNALVPQVAEWLGYRIVTDARAVDLAA